MKTGVMTDVNETLTPSFQHFDAFGVRLADLASGAAEYHWRGQEGSETAEYDAETHPAGSGRYGVSLVYMQTRDYDPETGRFLTPDALYISSLTTQGMNRYIYCNNDPVNYSDSSGRFGFLIPVLLSLAFAIGAIFGATAANELGASDNIWNNGENINESISCTVITSAVGAILDRLVAAGILSFSTFEGFLGFGLAEGFGAALGLAFLAGFVTGFYIGTKFL